MVVKVVEAGATLKICKLGDARGGRPWAALMLQPEAYRAPLGRDALRIEHRKTMSGGSADDRLHREGGDVLVINDVEQRFLKHVKRILRLEYEGSRRRKQRLDP